MARARQGKPVKKKAPAKTTTGRGGTDLFTWLDGLWTKQTPEGVPPVYMMHRFLASDPQFATVARELQQHVREPGIVFRTWQALLPRGSGAPRLSYIAAKKGAAAEELVTRMVAVLAERRSVVESMLRIAETAGRAAALYREFGVQAPKAAEA